jgi:hypothetical protein
MNTSVIATLILLGLTIPSFILFIVKERGEFFNPFFQKDFKKTKKETTPSGNHEQRLVKKDNTRNKDNNNFLDFSGGLLGI